MKKILLFVSALAGLFLVGSCQREEFAPAGEGNVVTFEVGIPEVATKANAVVDNGTNINDLVYAVYRTSATTLEGAKADENVQLIYRKNYTANPFQGNTAVVPIELINDQNYLIVFWAQVDDAWVEGDSFDLMRIEYPVEMNANDSGLAAFTNVSFISKEAIKGGAIKKDITLTRPFAQIRIATTLPQNVIEDVVLTRSSVTVTGAAEAFNVLKQEPITGTGEEPFAAVFNLAEVPEGNIEVNNAEYKYAAMNYIFANGNVDVAYNIETEKHGTVTTESIPDVPVKRNYRTNIVGNLLTSEAKYNVTLDQDWGTPDTEEYVWNGTEILQPAYNAETKTYTIKNAAELAWVANKVNANNYNFKGETVQLVADIDLGNYPWTPIGKTTAVCFMGTFEGVAMTKASNTYPTISNLFIENGSSAGLFAILCNGGRAKNFNMKNVNISGERQLGAVAGNIYGGLEIPVIENVTVEDVQITAVPAFDGNSYDNGDKVGGIVGLFADEAYVKNTTVKNATLKGYRDLGGITGSTQSGHAAKLIDNKVENLTFIVTGFYTPYKDNAESGNYAPIRGGRRSNAGDVIKNNSGNDIELHKVLVEATEGGVYDSEEKVYTVTSPAGLAAALQGSGAAGAGNHTIQINGDLDMTGMDWTPIKVDGYNGADIVTVEGNGATIKGLDGALFAGGFAGGSGIVIKDLTIEDAYMIADNTQGYGAFVNCADSMDEITLINCHLKNSTIITPNDGAAESRIGGLVGWTAGYNKQNDGPVDSYITIQNCSVTGCTLKGAGSIGGICGHAGANAATFTTIENCTVTGNTLVSTDDGDWRVGAIVGTANNGQCEIKNVTVSGNTISQVDKTAAVWQSEIYGRFVPAGTGTLKIDEVAVSATKPTLVNGYTALYDIDGNYYVYNKKGLEELNLFFKNNAFANHLWTRSYNIAADIDANGFTWDSVYVIVGNNANDGFVLNGCGHTISNLSINGSMFTGTPNGGNEGTKPGYVKDITIDRARVTGGFDAAVFWGNSYGELVYENVTVKNTSVTGDCNTAILLGRTTYEDGKGIDNILFKNCKVEKCSVVAKGCEDQDPTGASVFVGRAFGKTNLTFEGNSIDEATTIANNNGLVGGRVYAYTVHVDGNWEGTGACDTFTNWGGVSLAAKVGTTTYPTIEAAIAEAKAGDTVKLLDDVTLSSELALPAGIIFNGNGKQINGTIYASGNLTFAGHTKVTAFSASYYNRTITIGEGACLEVTGTGRVTLGYGNTFNITGNIENAKTADKANVQPSLIIPGGISITGGNDAAMNVSNAYVKIGSTTSKNSAANGTFSLNFTNAIAEFTNQLTFAEPTSGMNPTFNVTITNSILTTGTKFIAAAPGSNVTIDNSEVTLSSYFRNSGVWTLRNKSKLTGNTLQFGENGGNDGQIIVDASTLTVKAGNAASAFDGKGVGFITATNSATVNVDYYKDMTITVDTTSTFTGTEVQ